ncbi:putative histone H3/CENP-A [Lupinus albus]|uniref:Putative histone H3/CENP-A n=1 Tax=Lupinus albus TaxID=3870 RepID=A0A6A4PJV9_LUPAL|nr:putative histone H3/CENP-A [Lupinus albus]
MAPLKQNSLKPMGDKSPKKQFAKHARKHVPTTSGVKKPYSYRHGTIALR